ncbi:dihydroorotase [Synechococcus sp. C9]|uniref:dihydroorotase n=1 Tax=Synechococcus sp. C9 TaxID=102119 RepID=UPI001FF4D37C|nr:dihydroorotase [Synechococcus sp. C9]
MFNTDNNLWIHQAQLLGEDGILRPYNLGIQGGKITAITTEDHRREYEHILDAQGWVLLPGVIDPQVHFREPGLEHKEDFWTASHACAKGGVTSFLEMPNTRPLTTNQITLDDKLHRAAQKSLVNYGFFVGATRYNLTELNQVHPVCGIKIFMGSMHGDLLMDDPDYLEQIFAQGTRLIAVHAENQQRITQRRQQFATQYHIPDIHSEIQDDIAALQATELAVNLAIKYRRRLHILHLSTALEVEFLRLHKQPWITAEVTPQHLLLNRSAYQELGTLAQMNPPLRTAHDNQVLWQGLQEGLIDFMATDHAPHTLAEKAQPYPQSPSGMPGVETLLPLMLTQMKQGKCTLKQVTQWLSTKVAEAYKIPNKGRIAPGYDADLVLVDLEQEYPVRRADLQTKCGWSPFENWVLTGWPQVTIVGGRIVYYQGQFNEEVRGTALQFLSD